jgi:hypothetical protein
LNAAPTPCRTGRATILAQLSVERSTTMTTTVASADSGNGAFVQELLSFFQLILRTVTAPPVGAISGHQCHVLLKLLTRLTTKTLTIRHCPTQPL